MARDEISDEDVRTRTQIVWASKFLIVGVAVLIAAATFAISRTVPGTYSASSDVLVAAKSITASVDSVTGSNSLAAQYAQLAGTAGVLTSAAARAQEPIGALTDATRASTLANTNIVRITVTAGSPGDAEKRASAVSAALVEVGQKLADRGNPADPNQLKALDKMIADGRAEAGRLSSAVRRARPESAAAAAATTSLNNAQEQVSALTLKRIDVVIQARREAASQGATLSSLTPAPRAGQTAPKPLLYSLIGLVAGLFVMVEFAVLNERRRTPRRRGPRRPTFTG